MRKSKTKPKNGKLNAAEIRHLLNKQAGTDVSYDLLGDNPTEVKEWIPTGSRWLDSIICRGKLAGIPVGKITEIAGLESTGKSFIAAQVAANAQKMGIDVIYFDSESGRRRQQRVICVHTTGVGRTCFRNNRDSS